MRLTVMIALVLIPMTRSVTWAQSSGGGVSLRAVRDSMAAERLALRQARGDSGLLQLALVRQLYRVGRPAEGRTTLFLAAASASAAPAIAAMRKEILLGMPGSIALTGRWDTLTPAARMHDMQALWDDCDVDLAQPVGFCLEDHYARVLYAFDHFQLSREGRDTLNVRGQVWVKQGAPVQRVRVPGPTNYEVWKYERPFGPMIVYFSDADSLGRRGDMQVVSSLESAPLPVRLAACTLDSESCANGVPIPGMFSEPEWVSESVKFIFTGMNHTAPRRTIRGESARRYATTIRYTPARFLSTFRPAMQIAHLNGGPGSGRRFLVAIELRQRDLLGPGRGPATRYPIRVQVSVLDTANTRIDRDTTVIGLPSRALEGDTIVPLIVDFPIPDAVQTLSLAVTAPGGNRLHWMAREDLWTSLPLGSSLILGNTNRGVQWTVGEHRVGLNPTRTYEAGDTLVAYIQTINPPQIDSIWGRIVLGDGPAPPSPQHRLVVRPVPIAATAGRIEHRFVFPLDTLAPGTYHISFGLWWSLTSSPAQSTLFRYDTFTLRPRKAPTR